MFSNNNFQLIWNQKKQWFASVGFNYFNSSIERPNPYNFLDANIRYTTKKGKIQFQLSGNNLTNNNVFIDRSVSDFGTFENTQSLNERYVLLKVRFRF